MIERVARAIARMRYGSEGYRDEDDGVQYWELCMDEARVAIEAMREPTDEMYEVGEKYDNVTWVWEAMINAALTPFYPEGITDD